MDDAEFLEKRRQKWLAWVESELQKPGRTPEQIQSLRQQAEAIAKKRLTHQQERVGEMEARGIPKPIAEELALLHARLDGLVELLKHLPDILDKILRFQKRTDGFLDEERRPLLL
jgi:hypothetical protein